MEQTIFDMNRIKELIREKGLTQEDVANKMGISRVAVNQMVNGNPSYPTLENFAKALNVEMWELFISREEVIGNQLTALVEHKGTHYKATTLEELEMVVATIKSNQKRTE